MKRKKLLAAALTLVMALALAPAAFADPVTGSITIYAPASGSVSIDGQTFDVYCIFDLTMSDPDHPADSAYSYKTASNFNTFTYLTYDKDTLPAYVASLENDPTNLEAFATAVWVWIYNDGTPRFSPDKSESASGESVEIDSLDLGYYLVYGAGTEGAYSQTAVSLTTAYPDADITLKTDVPTITKKVSDTPGDANPGDCTDLDIGDIAHFTLTSKVPDMNNYASYVYTVHDTLSDGLTFNGAAGAGNDSAATGVTVTVNDASFTGYTVKTANIPDGEDFIIEFDPDVFIGLTPGADIVITYSATLNASAAVAASTNGYLGNSNKVYLEYSNNPYAGGTGKTPEDEVFVYTFAFGMFKYTLINKENPDAEENRTALANAEFKLYADENGSPASTALTFSGSNGIYKFDATTGAETLVSPPDGNIVISGLGENTYYLTEIKAPEGYNQLTASIEVKIVPSYSTGTLRNYTVQFKVGENFSTVDKVLVRNSTGIEFPESGGAGRTIFTVFGLLLMLDAGVVLFLRRRIARR